MDNSCSREYTFNGILYQVNDLNEIHERLTTDADFFNAYFKENVGSTEPIGVTNCASTSTCDRNDTQETAVSQAEFSWTQPATKLLLSLYMDRKQKFRDPKIKKKQLWLEIVKEFEIKGYHGVTEDILDRKMRNLKKTYKTIKDNNSTKSTGRGRISWEHYNTFEDIFHEDRTINIGHTISAFPADIPNITHEQTLTPSPSILSNTSEENFTSFLFAPISPVLVTSPFSSNVTDRLIDTASPSTASISSIDETHNQTSSPQPHPHHKEQKRYKNRQDYEYRKKLLDIEEQRVDAINKLRESITKSNEIQERRNQLLERLLNRQERLE